MIWKKPSNGVYHVWFFFLSDSTRPTITCPEDQFTDRLDVSWLDPVVNDNLDMPPTVDCTPQSGATFELGETPVFCVVTDTAGNMNACSFNITVGMMICVDTTFST